MAVSSRRTRNTDPRIDAAARAVVRKYKAGWRRGTLTPDQQKAIDASRSVKGWRSLPEERELVLKAAGMGGSAGGRGQGSTSSSNRDNNEERTRQLKARTTSGDKLYTSGGKFVPDYKERGAMARGMGFLPTRKSASRLQGFIDGGWTTKAPKDGSFDTRLVNIDVETPIDRGTSPHKNFRYGMGSQRTRNEGSQVALYRVRSGGDSGSGGGEGSTNSSGGGSGRPRGRTGGSSGSGRGGGKNGAPKIQNYTSPDGTKGGGRWVDNSPFSPPTYDGGYNNPAADAFQGRPDFGSPQGTTIASPPTPAPAAPVGAGLDWLNDVGRSTTAEKVEPMEWTPPSPVQADPESYDRVLDFLGGFDRLTNYA